MAQCVYEDSEEGSRQDASMRKGERSYSNSEKPAIVTVQHICSGTIASLDLNHLCLPHQQQKM